MGKLYNQLEVIKALRVSPTTVKRWIHYFSEFIPTVRQGDAVMYESGALKLLRRVRTLRNNRYSLKTILSLLEQEGFEKFAPVASPAEDFFTIPEDRPIRTQKPVRLKNKCIAKPEDLKPLVHSFQAVSREFAQIASQIDKLINED
ncbi:MerR family transcriptional regulator [Paenibacillus mesotrionivorans]|uniref:MerR family transcriptional regulator n=1 Tax=Paenibacillus mesotrionivorans TaxID=3160968 RepID=A0ACC7P9K1_9BACL